MWRNVGDLKQYFLRNAIELLIIVNFKLLQNYYKYSHNQMWYWLKARVENQIYL